MLPQIWHRDFLDVIYDRLSNLLGSENSLEINHLEAPDKTALVSVTIGRKTILRRVLVLRDVSDTDALLRQLAAVETVLGKVDLKGDFSESEREALEEGALEKSAIRLGYGSVQHTYTAYQQMVWSCLTVADFCKRVKMWRRTAVDRMVDRTLYCFKHERSWLLPPFQIYAKKPLRGIYKIAPKIHVGAHPLAVVRWFGIPHPDLNGMTPRNWAIEGRSIDRVAALVQEI